MQLTSGVFIKNVYCDKLAQQCQLKGYEHNRTYHDCMNRKYTETFEDGTIVSFRQNQVFVYGANLNHVLDLDEWFCDGRPPANLKIFDPQHTFREVHAVGPEMGAAVGYAAYKSGLLGGMFKLPVIRKIVAPVAIASGVIMAIDRGDIGDAVDEIVSGVVCTVLMGCEDAL